MALFGQPGASPALGAGSAATGGFGAGVSQFGQNLMYNPLFQFGLGVLGGNVGTSRGAAFANAMRGGAMGLQRLSPMLAQRQRTQMAQQVQEAAAARQALEDQRRQEMRAASIGLLGTQQGLSPEQRAYFEAQEDPYAAYMSTRPQRPEPIKVGGALLDPITYEPIYEPPQKGPLVSIDYGTMKPSEKLKASIDMVEKGFVGTVEEGLGFIDQLGGKQPITQAVQQNIASEAQGVPVVEEKRIRTLPQQQRMIRQNLMKTDNDGITGMEKADKSYSQSSSMLGKVERALDDIDKVWTGKLAGSKFGEWAQSAISEDASRVFNLLNEIATAEKVDMISATGAKAFDSEKESQALMKGLTSAGLNREVIKDRLKALKKKMTKNMSNYEKIREYATNKAGLDWITDPRGGAEATGIPPLPAGFIMVE